MTKGEINRLGDRLKSAPLQDSDLRLLDEFRRSFTPQYNHVVQILRDELHLAPSGRPVKTPGSIIAKLVRERTRLSTMQDIAGCRIIVVDIAMQESVAKAVYDRFANSKVYDRRIKPSHGYRAVHIVVREQGTPVEVQIRTSLQHLWAAFSEKVAMAVDLAVKYGGGPASVQSVLAEMSDTVLSMETEESDIDDRIATAQAGDEMTALENARRELDMRRNGMPREFNKRYLEILIDQSVSKRFGEGQ